MGSNPDAHPLPFWQVNVAPQHREATCPPYLQNLGAKDIAIIGTDDADYTPHTWAEVTAIVRSGRLEKFRRRPSDLRRYREYLWHLQREWGSVTAYMLRERLHWDEKQLGVVGGVDKERRLFACEEDYRILCNDWPYGVDERIVHLVVWTKFALPDDDETETAIREFVERTFLPGVRGRDQLCWFKNPPSLKSVHALEHIHVMLFDPDPTFVRALTNGDRPRCELLKAREMNA